MTQDIKEYFGYFELEVPNRDEYHKSAIKLNAARYALEYVVKAKTYNKILLPHYICDTVANNFPDTEIEYYYLDSNFWPKIDNYSSNTALIYPNYFGLYDQQAEKVAQYYDNVILDNTQAFYHVPPKNIDSCYSARKFFGVSDGAYLYTDTILNYEIGQDYSSERFKHLLIRAEKGANAGYPESLKCEDDISASGMRKMSPLTQKILKSLNYEDISSKRLANFTKMHSILGKINEYDVPHIDKQVPMIYPYIIQKPGLREYLIKNKIFAPQWWKKVLNVVEPDSWEYYLSSYLVPLPIDQRYEEDDVLRVAELVENFVN